MKHSRASSSGSGSMSFSVAIYTFQLTLSDFSILLHIARESSKGMMSRKKCGHHDIFVIKDLF